MQQSLELHAPNEKIIQEVDLLTWQKLDFRIRLNSKIVLSLPCWLLKNKKEIRNKFKSLNCFMKNKENANKPVTYSIIDMIMT